MEINSDFKKAVDSKKVRLTRIMLKNSIILDPTFKEFDVLLKYAEMNLSDLYDAHDGETFSNDITSWTKEYMNQEMVKVVDNFSKERIEFLRKISHQVYAERVEEKEKEDFINEHKPGITRKQGGALVAASGVVMVAVGAIKSYTIITGLGVVAIIAGGALVYLSDDKKK